MKYMPKGYILAQRPQMQKIKVLSSTFKVEEKKVPLFFELVASGLRYGRFLIFFFGIFRHFLKLPLYKCLYFYLKIGKFLKRT